MNIDIVNLKRLMRALRRYDFDEVELREGDQSIVLRRSPRDVEGRAPAFVPPAPSRFPMDTGDRATASGVDDAAPAVVAGLITVTAPLVGTFYRAASPQARPFVEVGSTVHPGDPLCIIEAMKLMNEIEAECSGTVVEVLVDNERAVEYGEPLFRLRPSR